MNRSHFILLALLAAIPLAVTSYVLGQQCDFGCFHPKDRYAYAKNPGFGGFCRYPYPTQQAAYCDLNEGGFTAGTAWARIGTVAKGGKCLKDQDPPKQWNFRKVSNCTLKCPDDLYPQQAVQTLNPKDDMDIGKREVGKCSGGTCP